MPCDYLDQIAISDVAFRAVHGVRGCMDFLSRPAMRL